jgi:hypothetical protein
MFFYWKHISLTYRAYISGRQSPGWTRGSPRFYITNVGGEAQVKPGVWRPEMWAQVPEHIWKQFEAPLRKIWGKNFSLRIRLRIRKKVGIRILQKWVRIYNTGGLSPMHILLKIYEQSLYMTHKANQSLHIYNS